MKYKAFGTSKLALPVIGQGMGIGGFYAKQAKYTEQHRATLTRGLELGMNFIDTAEIYGEGQAEVLLGEVISTQRDRVIVSTKFSPEHNGYDDVLRSAEQSLTRLKTDYLDIYQMHWPNPKIPLENTMRALERLVQEGKVRYIGASNCSLRQLKAIRSYLSGHDIIAAQVEYNLFDRSIEEEFLPYCQSEGIATVAYSPLIQGKITNGSQKRKALEAIANKYQKTSAQVVLQWLVSRPGVVAIPNTGNLVHLEANAKAADFDLHSEDAQAIDQLFQQRCHFVPTDQIRIAADPSANVYRSAEEAIENRFGQSPSPLELAQEIRDGEVLKPIRIVSSPDSAYVYDLAEGRSRYWAWVLAHEGQQPIPAYLRED